MKNYDVILIGAGIVGAMITRELSCYELKVLWIEKESDIGMGASGANSAILHSGHDPEPGTLKAEMNVQGNKLWKQMALELDIPFRETGAFVVAVGSNEFSILGKLFHRGVENGIPGLKILGREEMLKREPQLNPKISGALWTPTAGVIDPFRAVVGTAENAVLNGVELLREVSFEGFIIENQNILGIHTNMGDLSCRMVINAAGLYSDEIMHKAGVRADFVITPRRGEYLIFDAAKVSLNHVFFPVPNDKGKGTLVSTTTHGNVMIGPNANEVQNRMDTETSARGLKEIFQNARKLVPSLNEKDVIAQFAGVRASGNANRDFVIEIAKEVRGLVNVAGIDSPGFVSAPAIAKKTVRLLEESGMILKKKVDWNPIRKAKPIFRQLSHKERSELIKQNPTYGRIVCRCEFVTEGEVIDAIHSLIPAQTYDAVKRRTWLGTGRCQGGFDYPRVMEILSEQLGTSMTTVTKKGGDSRLVYRSTKGVENE